MDFASFERKGEEKEELGAGKIVSAGVR